MFVVFAFGSNKGWFKGISMLLTFLFVVSPLHAQNPIGIGPDNGLNQAKVRELYFDGSFSAVIDALEHFRAHNSTMSKAEEVFTYKFLSVVYAANPNTKLKAEFFMYELLKLVPTIQLIDMYVSASVEAQFEAVKRRFQAEQEYTSKYDLLGVPRRVDGDSLHSTSSTSTSSREANVIPVTQPKKKENSFGWVPWTIGGLVIAGATVAYFLLGSEDPGPGPTVIVSPPITQE